MKVKVASDLHLELLTEFSIIEAANRLTKTHADILILAGDICPLKSKRWKSFIKTLQPHFSNIIWVPGNHEYYGSNFHLITDIHRKRLAELDQSEGLAKIHFLDDETIIIDNVQFIGSTLWTDFDKRNPIVMQHVAKFMNDFYRIKFRGRNMMPEHQYILHKAAVSYIFKMCKTGRASGLENFVITHHGPSWLSVAEKFKHDEFSILFNGAFVSDLSEQIRQHNIHTWVHGHTHVSFDYDLWGTRVYVNPHGYQEENVWEYNPDQILEVN